MMTNHFNVRDNTGLTFDDVLLVPQNSPVQSRSEVSIDSVVAGDVNVSVPIISSNMDTVTETEMADSMAEAGGFGIIHRYMESEEQANMIQSVSTQVGASVGVSVTEDDVRLLEDAGANVICVDVAHGDLQHVQDIVTNVVNWSTVPVIAGNIATYDAAKHLVGNGVDAVKVGIGPGSACITRQVTGVGVPQITAISNVADYIRDFNKNNNDDIRIIADGGIRTSGDIVKALMAGADTVMLGGLLSTSTEAPGNTFTNEEGDTFKEFRGMASSTAREDRATTQKTTGAVEGVSGKKRVDGPVSEKLHKLQNGIKSGLSYCGGYTIEEARKNHEFIKISNATVNMNSSHL